MNNTNAFGGWVKLTTTDSSGNDSHATIDNGTTALVLNTGSVVKGNLTVTTGHVSGITDNGAVTVGGNLVATTDDNNGVIDLGTTTVTGTVALNTNGLSLIHISEPTRPY